jgi:tetratricopeptide (TPR) repeat protein
VLYQQGQYSEATKVAEETFEPDDPDVATSLNNLAELYYAQGGYAEAAPLFKRSLAIWEKSLGPDDPNVATVCENMVKCCKKLGKEYEGEKLEARARNIRLGQ